MKYSLGDFFLGIIHIFVIFLPGGIFIATLLYGIPELKSLVAGAVGNKEAGWLLLIVASFVVGHFVSYAASEFEDRRFKKTGGERAQKEVPEAMRIGARAIVQSVIPASLVEEKNVRRWAHALLRQSESGSFRDVEIKDADRRFFRNFIVVMVVPIIVFLIRSFWDVTYLIAAALAALFLVFGYLRYRHQDKMFTRLIFESLVAADPEKMGPASPESKETERRFLVGGDAWRGGATGMDITQGYLSLEKERVVRVRIEGEKGWLTLKGKSTGATQPEYEYQIPVADARSILENLRDGRLIEKTRYKITYKGVVWEVDDFKGENSGLVIAEVEGESEDELETAVKNKPDWIGEEITSKYEFRNVNLAKHPYTTWRGKGNVVTVQPV